MKILHISDPHGRHAELTNLPEDEDRNYFLIEIPCREGFKKKWSYKWSFNREGVICSF